MSVMKNKVQKEQLNLLCNLIPLDGIHFLAKVTFINISNALKYHFKGKKKKKKMTLYNDPNLILYYFKCFCRVIPPENKAKECKFVIGHTSIEPVTKTNIRNHTMSFLCVAVI